MNSFINNSNLNPEHMRGNGKTGFKSLVGLKNNSFLSFSSAKKVGTKCKFFLTFVDP